MSEREVRGARGGPDLHTLGIQAPHITGMGAVVTLDGKEVNGLTGVDVRLSVADVNTVTFRLLVAAQDITARAATVWYEVHVQHPDGSEHHASAPSIPEALRELAEDLDAYAVDEHRHGSVEP